MQQGDVPGIFKLIEEEMAKAGRDAGELEHSMILRVPIGAKDAGERIAFMADAGFHRIVFLMTRGDVAQQQDQLEWFTELAKTHGR